MISVHSLHDLRYKARRGAESASPLALFVHGRAGSIDVMSTFLRSVPESFHAVFVEAPHPDPLGGVSWWRLGTEDDPLEAALRLERFLRDLPSELGVTPSRAIALGFSQGGALLSVVTQRSPELLAGAALLASFVIETGDRPSKPLPPFFFAHGTRDETVPIDTARKGADYLRALGAEVEFHEDDASHKVGITGMRALKTWIGRFETK